MDAPKTLLDAVRHFSDYQNCHDFMVVLRWPDGVTCPHVRTPTALPGWRSSAGGSAAPSTPLQQFTLKTGTIFEDSPLPLAKWLPAVWLIVNCKNGVSSYETRPLHRRHAEDRDGSWATASAWRSTPDRSPSWLAKWKWTRHSSAGRPGTCICAAAQAAGSLAAAATDKTAVLGVLEAWRRSAGDWWFQDRKKRTLQTGVRKHVAAGSALFSDELMSYHGLDALYAHEVINHAVRVR